METILLASASPRRRELLQNIKIPFVQEAFQFNETHPQQVNAVNLAPFLAEKKLNFVLRTKESEEYNWVLCADTVVVSGDKALGKPVDKSEAIHMLKMLSDNTHQVFSAVSLYNRRTDTITTKTSATAVTFSELSSEEINWYISTEEWRGAAGAYKIQERACVFVKNINGEYFTIVGLPINVFYGMLKKNNYFQYG